MNFRLLAGLGCLAAFGALGFAYYLQYFHGLQPCPLCIFQRVAIFATGLVFLVGAAHGPRGGGRWVYGLLAFVTAGIGAGIAGRHVWLQSLPPDQVPACGPGLAYLLDIMPWQQVMAKVLRGDASCADIQAGFLGLSLPGWTLVAFIGLALWALLSILLSNRKSSGLST